MQLKKQLEEKMQRQRGGDGFGRVLAILLAGLLGLGAFSQAMATHVGKHCPHESNKLPGIAIVNGIFRKGWKDDLKYAGLFTHVGRTGSSIRFDIFFDECMNRDFVPKVEAWIGDRKLATVRNGQWRNEKHYHRIDSSRFIADTFVVGDNWPEGEISIVVSNFRDVGPRKNIGKKTTVTKFREVREITYGNCCVGMPQRKFLIDRSRF